ncbi:hypothetical protein Megvenef_00834 [Candidatus Megaera venefica]|uniref:Uncharacterized protein n=1 Tax=Candidatus Megaera venefica TaxID=2055910 RepID=A0ABU5NCH7_9RICK|nr:hypothetical protein [Candidatus Megaera venefica]
MIEILDLLYSTYADILFAIYNHHDYYSYYCFYYYCLLMYLKVDLSLSIPLILFPFPINFTLIVYFILSI